MQCPRAVDRRHRKGLFGGEDFRIAAENFLQFRRRVHFFPQIQIVVRRRAVRSQTDRQIFRQHFDNRRDA